MQSPQRDHWRHWNEADTASVSVCQCWVTHLQDVSSIHSICAGGYSLKYPKMSCVLMSSTPVMWIASRRSRDIAEQKQKSKARNYRYKQMTWQTTAGFKKIKKIINKQLSLYLSSSCPYPAERCADCCSPPHRSGTVALASLSARWPPDKYKCTTFQQNHPPFFNSQLSTALLGVCAAAGGAPATSTCKVLKLYLDLSGSFVLLLSSASHRLKYGALVEGDQ